MSTYTPHAHFELSSRMLCIRLQRTGSRNNPTFRVVVADKRRSAKGKSLEILGHYLPARNPPVFEFKKERIEHWVKNGAIPSETMARLLMKSGVKGMEKYTTKYTKQRKKGEVDEPPSAPAAPAPSAPSPAEEPQQKVDEPSAPAPSAPSPAEEPQQKEEVKDDNAEKTA